ncbi:MAG: tetratricopeptide repeat protein [Planctomycetes bacterium]|nr:tetratricopeptide repeat protein [Planctomycetota bacterium]MCH9727539.1 tetratricopeptide repeat protein [Planctomycetota bacterium]MCH9777481.1 tetratricopeptide repeat protein [Planctomycetota bacterium]MCH9791768.1 tetratricopeptide repeat protein [Planctomycetota bacterium]MDF1746901.1 tetratricopeptide repeat protein [Gimesia sp.]
MKSEHRHELQTNDLSKLLVHAEPFLEKYGIKTLVAAGILFVVVIGYLTWSSNQEKRDAEGWTRLAASNSTEDFENVVDEFPGTQVADWALIHAAESQLQSGIRNSFSDRSAGDRDLKDAKENFQKLLESSTTLPEIRERALFGMARTEESTSDGDLKNSIDLYKKLIQEYPTSIFRKLAEQRVKPVEGEKVAVLDQEGTKNFYKWFHAQTPKPGDRQRPGFNLPMPGGAPGGAKPSGGVPVLPELPAGGLPGTPDPPALPALPTLPGLPEPVTPSPPSDAKKPTAPAKESPAKPESKSGKKPEAPAKKAPAEKPKSEPAPEKKP